MATSKERDKEHTKGRVAMKTPPIVSEQEWKAAQQQLLVKEKASLYLRNAAKLLPDGGLEGGTPFTATITGSHIEGVDQRTKTDGGPLPIYLKVDRSR
jgi:hypothetical protein